MGSGVSLPLFPQFVGCPRGIKIPSALPRFCSFPHSFERMQGPDLYSKPLEQLPGASWVVGGRGNGSVL